MRLGVIAVLAGIALVGFWSFRAYADDCPLQNKYDQCIFLTTHNAMANWEDGWLIHAQQGYYDVADQLDEGVRGLMLDIFKYDEPAEDGYVLVFL
jgi:hypothetical protein